MNEQLFECGLCGELTLLIRKSEILSDGIKHEFAECEKCKGKSTIMYTNNHIRGLLALQRKTKPGNKKVELADKINKEAENLRTEMEKRSE